MSTGDLTYTELLDDWPKLCCPCTRKGQTTMIGLRLDFDKEACLISIAGEAQKHTKPTNGTILGLFGARPHSPRSMLFLSSYYPNPFATYSARGTRIIRRVLLLLLAHLDLIYQVYRLFFSPFNPTPPSPVL
jgi:hypothetical protein